MAEVVLDVTLDKNKVARRRHSIGFSQLPKRRFTDYQMNYIVKHGSVKNEQLYLRINSEAPVEYMYRYFALNIFEIETSTNVIYRPLPLFDMTLADFRKYFLLDHKIERGAESGAVKFKEQLRKRGRQWHDPVDISWSETTRKSQSDLKTEMKLVEISPAYAKILPACQRVIDVSGQADEMRSLRKDIEQLEDSEIKDILLWMIDYRYNLGRDSRARLEERVPNYKNRQLRSYLSNVLRNIRSDNRQTTVALADRDQENVLIISSGKDSSNPQDPANTPGYQDTKFKEAVEDVEEIVDGTFVTVASRNTDDMINGYDDLLALLDIGDYQHVIFLGHGSQEGNGFFLEFNVLEDDYLNQDHLPMLSASLRDGKHNAVMILSCYGYQFGNIDVTISNDLAKAFNVVYSENEFSLQKETEFIIAFYKNYVGSGDFQEAFAEGISWEELNQASMYKLNTKALSPI